ncbi:MAG: TonB-dependent receptor plug domain-containing protein [Gemmatirosa sp.]|nr:TonB-dependent receptor plug domain-containing protein [Gemmatirosa sp.]
MRRSSLDVRFRSAAAAALVALAAAACAHNAKLPQSSAEAQRDSIQVGYGTQAKRNVTGSISNVDGDVVRQATVTTLADMLDGHVPGIQVTRLGNGGVSVRVRGEHSLMADGEPLYVVDGVPMSGGTGVLPDLDPRDVKSIQVLKDAGSLAAYGSRGANGVILINTRKPSRP